jgi:glyoxylase-like metal-dependent hydrolase (beta-lactamase superfamily II)
MLVLLGTLGCADVTGPQDGVDLGPVVQVQDWFTSAYLAVDGDTQVMFDAGWREGPMRRSLDDHGVAMDQVDHVLLTHGHSDHVGALSGYTSASVGALSAEFEGIQQEAGVTPDVALDDGQVLTLGALEIEVFAVPGHTAGTAVYLIDGVLILGDTVLQNADGQLVATDDGYSDAPDQNVDSVRALAERLSDRSDEIRWLAPAHSAPMEGFDALADF